MRLQKTAGALTALAAAGAVAIPVAAARDGHGAAHAAANHVVTLKSIRFHPAALSVKRGDTVTWVWRDGPTAHNVTGSGFKSKTMAKGSFKVRFTRKGTFNYRCTIHSSQGMVGKVVVH
jgi:plastocyanin